MAKEIERKFLINKKQALKFINDSKNTRKLEIEQFYVQLKDPEIRYRKTKEGLITTYVKTTKAGTGLSRDEDEYEVDIIEYQSYIVATSLIINKIRYVVNDLEFDFYQDGLAILEKEYDSIEEANADPMNYHFIEKEVTGDNFFSNAEIALRNSKRD